MGDFSYVAERAGFEPANLCGLHAFQACALSQTTRPLHHQAAKLYQKLKHGSSMNELCFTQTSNLAKVLHETHSFFQNNLRKVLHEKLVIQRALVYPISN